MKPKIKSFEIVLLAVSLLLACSEGDKSLDSDFDASSPIKGIWESKDYTQGYRDTVITFYEFLADSQFEYGHSSFRNGQYEDTLYKGGFYSIPVPGLLLLSYRYTKQGDDYTNISEEDTLIFTMKNFIELILWGTPRTFKQISGKPGELRGGTFYNVKKHVDVYIHSRFEFKGDSAYFSSTYTTQLEEPPEWPPAFKYRVTAFGGLMTFYKKDGSATSNGYALYNSSLIFTYTQQIYLPRF